LLELDSILDFIVTQNPQGAARVHARIARVIELSAAYPFVGSSTDRPRIRRLVATPYPYLIFYEPSDEEIIIHSIRHARRQPL